LAKFIRRSELIVATVVLLVVLASHAEAQLAYSLAWGWQGDARQGAADTALTNILNRYNAYGNFTGGNGSNVQAAYNPGVPTAQAGYGGWGGIIEYGGTWPNDRVTMHELDHWLGGGTYSNANSLSWNGPRAISIIEQFEGVGARVGTDGVHFWPYGMNFDNEWSELNAQRNVALMYALRADWGIGSTVNPTAWNATNVSLVASDPAGTSGFNRGGTWSDNTFVHPNADYTTGAFDLRTPNGYPSWEFAGKSLTVNSGGRLLYNSWGHDGVITIKNLTLEYGTLRQDQFDGNPNAKLDTFRLAGNVNLVGTGTFDAAEGDIEVYAPIAGSGSLNKIGSNPLKLTGEGTYGGNTIVSAGTLELTGSGSTGYGTTTLANGTALLGNGMVHGTLSPLTGSRIRVGAAGLSLQLPSGHVLLDDFEAYRDGATATATGGVWNAEFAGTANSNIVAASGHGQALRTLGGAAWRGAERNLTGTDAAVRVDETQTYFWQVKSNWNGDPGETNWVYDFMMGLSPSVNNIDSTDAWQDFSVMPFINNAPTTPFINAEAPTTPYWAAMSADQWHNVWVVINNDAVDPTFDLYYSPESDPDNPVLVISDANWRNFAPGQDLNAIGFMAAGAVGSEFLVDNIYYISGATTANPLGQTPTLSGETLTVGGDLNVSAGSTLSFDIASPGINDSINIGGALSVTEGAIIEVLLDSTVSASSLLTGDSWELFDFNPNDVSGSFDINDFLLPAGLASGLAWDTTNLLTTGVLSVSLSGDFNLDGTVDGHDFLVWQRDPAVGDLSDWRANYGNSAPMVSSANVPEPSSGMLVALAVVATLLSYRPRTTYRGSAHGIVWMFSRSSLSPSHSNKQ